MLLHLLLCSSIFSTSIAVEDETDRSALLDLKNGITRDPSGILLSWNQTTASCEWEGVTCGRGPRPRVTALNLSSRGLVGSLSPSLGNLTFLETLFLMSNGFSGRIPPQIGRLHHLQQLNLSYNSFRGEIPANLSFCYYLVLVDLNYNGLTGRIPSELSSLSKLNVLGLAHNNFGGQIPPWLGNLSALTRLSMASNGMDGGIPRELGHLRNLQTIVLDRNMLSGMIPSTIFNLSSLSHVSMALNQLQGSLPPDMGDTLPNLQNLLLAGNQLSGPVPASLTNASGLIIIDLPNNNFSGSVPPDLGRLQDLQYLNLNLNHLRASDDNDWQFFTSLTNCTNLKILDLAVNDLVGELPASIANLSTQLQQIQLQDNLISGSISLGIQNLVSLLGLALYDNLLTGSIPDGVGKLNKLQWLGLYDNRFTGQIPLSIGNLTLLNYLGLATNNLQGPIPLSLGNLQQLSTLALNNNKLNGNIPKEIVSLSSLSYVLNLANNSFVGSLPPEVRSLTNLEAFYVSGNHLSGEIPAEISDCQSLEYLSLDNNRFSGAIPSSMGSLRGLRNLDLSHNNLSGPIPESLENLDALENLDLSFNHLEGQVPDKGVFDNATVISLLGNDGLCGGISQLHLHRCPEKFISIERRGVPRVLKIVIPIIGSVVCLVILFCLAYIYKRKRPIKKNSAMSSIGEQFQKISYAELAQATEGFSSTNLVGMGRYGAVYRGTLDNGGTVVAVKVFNLQQQGASKSFIDECEALRRIRHRNLVKILTTCSSVDSKGDDFKALVFEFMPNGNLETWLHAKGGSQNLSLVQRLNISNDVADALNYLHHDCDPPVVHCDLKPSNVLIDTDTRAHVGDFGIAKILHEAATGPLKESSVTIGVRGSIGYVPPEYGIGCQVSTSGDVYSFGILILEMFTGRRPINDIFKDGLSLYRFVEMGFPDRVMEIADPLILSQEENGTITQVKAEAIKECLSSMLKVGLYCANQSPIERTDITDAANEIRKIREAYLKTNIQQDRHD